MGEIPRHAKHTSITPLHNLGTYSAHFTLHIHIFWIMQNIVSNMIKIKMFLNMINLTLWYFLKTCNYYKIILKPCVTWDSMECEMGEYEFLILDIIVAWRIYFKIFKILATILSVLYAW